jgi:acetoin utilization deacetylase AcuC-like enzyme
VKPTFVGFVGYGAQAMNSDKPNAQKAQMQVWFHPLYTEGIHRDARFPRERYRQLAARLQAEEDAGLIRIRTAPLAARTDLLLAHDESYVDAFLQGNLSPKEVRRIGLRPWTDDLIPRTLHIVGGALAALSSVLESGGFAGNMAGGTHHAHRDFGSGYCVFNDLAICARKALRDFDLRRVSVLDLDVHQGDGTATILSRLEGARTVSVHCAKNFPFRKAESDFDLPVEEATTDQDFLAIVDQAIERAMEFEPDLLLFQAGVDGLATDTLGRLSLSREGMRVRNQKVFAAAQETSTPCLLFMGGGYSNPIEPTVDAFFDLFVDAAQAHRAER